MNSKYEIPNKLLDDVLWDFRSKEVYASQEKFNAAVWQHYRDIHKFAEEIHVDDWKPDRFALGCSGIIVRYFADPIGASEGAFHTITLKSSDERGFSAGELLFGLHNAAVVHLGESGHHIFEGLTLAGTNSLDMPVYQMIGGS